MTLEDWQAAVAKNRKMAAEGNTFCNPASQEGWETLVADYPELYCAICPCFDGLIGIAGSAGTIAVWCETPRRKQRVVIMPQQILGYQARGGGQVCNGSCDPGHLQG